jgi:N-acetylmuramoyl-L-alanine amidase
MLRTTCFGSLIAAAACAPSSRTEPAPAPARPPSVPAATPVARGPALPPVPKVTGALAIKVVYPPAGATIQARDSTFIFGSIGNGDAALSINGTPAVVYPNGAFIAWLPVPSPTDYHFTLVARLGADSARLVHRLTPPAPRPALSEAGPLTADSASVTPRGTRTLRGDEMVRVSIRTPVNATAVIRLADGRELPMPGSDQSGAVVARVHALDLPARDLSQPAALVVARGGDTLRLTTGSVTIYDPREPRFVTLTTSTAVPDTDKVVTARPVPAGTYKWFLIPGTVVEATGRIGEFVRVRLDSALEVWVNANDAQSLPAGTPAPRRVAADARLAPGPNGEWTDLIIPIGERPPYDVRAEGNSLVLTLYGTVANTDILAYAGNDSLVRRVSWRQEAGDRARFDLELPFPPYGYLVLWQRNALVLRVRRPPHVDAASPLKGLTIAVNAGHPPAGSTGPTGLYEPVPTLAISEHLKTILERRGATVVMVRTTPAPMDLAIRPVIGRRADADAFVSIHLNALPDGVNPFNANGTGTYYFYPPSIALARAVQSGVVRHLGLRNLGIFYDNLSDLRNPWMPSVLCEGAFIILPDQEAALRTPEFQELYALGVADGLEEYFRMLAR